jgi:multisubunit Na+/H+ antiporter MnhG subunit
MGVSAVDWLDAALLGLAVLVVLASALGVAVNRTVAVRLHLMGPAATVAPALVLVAIVVREGFDVRGLQTLVAVAILLVAQPILSHVTLRADRIRRVGDWRGRPEARRP